MPKIVLLDAETRGVDLRTNPLFLGKKKLHAAVNLIFEEGVIRSRFGFDYNFLGCTGRFQGFAEYFPKAGISTEVFSSVSGNLVVAVNGMLYMNCERVACITFPSDEDINLYQAENWLIIQHHNFSTYWWDGSPLNCAVRSPGVSEQNWDDGFGAVTPLPTPDPPIFQPPTPPTPPPPPPPPDQDSELQVLVVDAVTEEEIESASVTFTVNGNTAYSGVTNSDGNYTVIVTKRRYDLNVSKDPYLPQTGIVVDGTNDQIVVVRLRYDIQPFNVLGFLTVPATDIGTVEEPNIIPGLTDISSAFGVPLDGVPPGNAYRTVWRLVTDDCGFHIVYQTGLLDDTGAMLLGEWDGIFESFYLHAEGMYVQLGVIVNGVETWSDASPCIAGGNGTPL